MLDALEGLGAGRAFRDEDARGDLAADALAAQVLECFLFVVKNFGADAVFAHVALDLEGADGGADEDGEAAEALEDAWAEAAHGFLELWIVSFWRVAEIDEQLLACAADLVECGGGAFHVGDEGGDVWVLRALAADPHDEARAVHLEDEVGCLE